MNRKTNSKINSKPNSVPVEIEFDRNIDLFLPKNIFQISSDYQFTSYLESTNETDAHEEKKTFLNYLEKKDESSYDSKIFLKKYFFSNSHGERDFDFTEDKFNAFLCFFLKIICPDNLYSLNEKDLPEILEEYQRKFKKNDLISHKSLYIWCSLGLEQKDFQFKLIPNNDGRFDIDKLLVLHNLCVIFSYKLNFIYFNTIGISLPKLFSAGCIYTENTVNIGLLYDIIGKKRTHHLFVSKPKSTNQAITTEMKDFFTISTNEIFNMSLLRCYLFGKEKSIQPESFYSQIQNLISKMEYNSEQVMKFDIKAKSILAKSSNFLFPKIEKKDAQLFKIFHPKNITIIDVCFNDTSVYVISSYEFQKQMFIQIYEGNIGTQFLDDMYLCAEIMPKESDITILGKITLIKCKYVSTPTAIILTRYKNTYTIYIYKKPEIKPLNNKSISNNFYYPSSSQYYTRWQMIYKKVDGKSAQTFEARVDIVELDFDGTSLLFKDEKEDRFIKVSLDYMSSIGGINKYIDENRSKLTYVDAKSDDADIPNDAPFLSVEKDIIGVEMNNLLFLLLDKKHNVYYHPARNNFYLKSAIKSAFYRYKEQFPKTFFEKPKDYKSTFLGIIKASIDVGYSGDINKEFGSNSIIPGIYFATEDYEITNAKKPKSNPEIILRKLSIAFANAGMIIGKDVHRTKCQLIASYAFATDFKVYGPNEKITEFKPKNEVYDNWDDDTPQEMLANLVATYGVLLEMKNDHEFNIALKTLKTTKSIYEEFNVFYDEFKNTLFDIYK